MAPLLSFVVLGDGPDGLAGAELADVEVVRVGGAPGTDPRVRALPAPDGGAAAALDAGLAAAEGEYVWCLEPGAAPAPGAIAAVAERLRAERPELLLVDRGGRRKLLGRVAGDGLVTLDRRPGLAATAPRLGDKILRRTFVRALGVRFA